MFNYLLPYNIITNGDMSQPSLTSTIIDTRGLHALALQFVFTGTPTGTFTVQGSLDYCMDNVHTPNAGTWTALNIDPAPVASGASGNILIDLVAFGAPYIQVIYTSSGGAGTLNVMASGKVI